MDSNRKGDLSSHRQQPSSSRATQQMSFEDKLRRDTFKMAYFTEIGATSRPIDISEFHDLVVCAGIDIDKLSIQEAWPKNKDEITMDEAYHLFTKLPNMELKIKHTLEMITTNNEIIPYDSLYEYINKKTDIKNEKQKEKLMNMIQKWKEENISASQALLKFNETKSALRDFNKALSDRARQEFTARSESEKLANKLNMNNDDDNDNNEENNDDINNDNKNINNQQHNNSNHRVIPVLDVEFSDSGDYSSVFVEDQINYDVETDGRYSHDTLSLAQRPLSDHPLSEDEYDNTEIHMFKTIRKSLVMQKIDGKNTSVGHVFTLTDVRTIQIQVYVDDKIDSDLNRFENAIYGTLQRIDGQIIILTTRKKDKRILTDKCTLFPGKYIFYVNFCRQQNVKMLKEFDKLYDKDTGKLSTKYRVCIMNIFDIFDFNDDQILNYHEFLLYNKLNGSGELLNDQWLELLSCFDTRDNGLTLKAFVDMHQYELDSYEDKNELTDMLISLKQLGFNEHFQLSLTCPIFIEYLSSDDQLIIDNYDIDYVDSNNKNDLIEYYWKYSEQLPYLKDLNIKLYSTEYYAVLLAGSNATETHYQLRLDGSKNVNLDVDKSMIVDKIVLPNTCEILVVGIAVDTNSDWYISVRKFNPIASNNNDVNNDIDNTTTI